MFQFQSLNDFISMGGHGPYVWASYGVSLLAMAALVVGPALKLRQVRRHLASQSARKILSSDRELG